MGRTAFFLRAYNDIDHIAPIIWKFIKKNQKPIVIFHTDVEYQNDYRINFLQSEGEVEIIRDLDVEYVKYERSSKNPIFRLKRRLYRLRRNHNKLLGKIYKKYNFDCIKEVKFLSENGVSQCVFEWGTPFDRGEVINKYFIASLFYFHIF